MRIVPLTCHSECSATVDSSGTVNSLLIWDDCGRAVCKPVDIPTTSSVIGNLSNCLNPSENSTLDKYYKVGHVSSALATDLMAEGT
jgi:hypothetical protein